MTPTDLGAKVRELRTDKGWSQDRLAREIEMTKQTVYDIESGRSNPTLSTIKRLAAAFGVSISVLLQEEGVA